MNSGVLIDLIVLILLVVGIARGWEIGWSRQFFSAIGFFGGLFLGATIQPHIVNLAHTTLSRTIITLVVTLGLAFALLTLGEFIGYKLKSKINIKKLNTADNILGSIISVVTVLFSVWLCAAILSSLNVQGIQGDINNSGVIKFLDDHLPNAPSVISDIGSLIDPNGFPQVFVNGEPAVSKDYALPSEASMQSAIDMDKASVVKIQGLGCGGIVEGSGFIVRPGIVVTNAHVVAGIENPYIYDDNGSHSAQVIWFDPNLDLAILKTTGLSGKPLRIDTNIAADGTAGAVLGYPGGGPFQAKVASVLNEFLATGKNIYGTGTTNRSVYEIRADIIPGNSGGPLIISNGDVIAVVFAQSTTYYQVGYAITANQIVPDINLAVNQNRIHGTGSCAE